MDITKFFKKGTVTTAEREQQLQQQAERLAQISAPTAEEITLAEAAKADREAIHLAAKEERRVARITGTNRGRKAEARAANRRHSPEQQKPAGAKRAKYTNWWHPKIIAPIHHKQMKDWAEQMNVLCT